MLLHDGIGAVFLAVEHQHPGVFGQAHIAEGFFDPRHGERRRWVRNQVIEREQGVRLPAAKGGLHLGHGRRGAAAHATGNVADRLLEVLREVGVREEERRIQVFLPRRARIVHIQEGHARALSREVLDHGRADASCTAGDQDGNIPEAGINREVLVLSHIFLKAINHKDTKPHEAKQGPQLRAGIPRHHRHRPLHSPGEQLI